VPDTLAVSFDIILQIGHQRLRFDTDEHTARAHGRNPNVVEAKLSTEPIYCHAFRGSPLSLIPTSAALPELGTLVGVRMTTHHQRQGLGSTISSMSISRRSFVVLSAMLPWALKTGASIPIGLELYSVREALKQGLETTVRSVAEMGYECVEFYAPYFQWSETQAKQMRKLLDDLGIRCFSTHNDEQYFSTENINRMRDLNLILGCKYVVMASGEASKPGDWHDLAEKLNFAAEQLESSGLKPGYHNHQLEFTPANSVRPIEILAKNTKPSIMLQLDVGTCLEASSDPVAWIRANPGRIRSLHLKDWSPDPAKGYKVLFGEGIADWKNIFAAAESVGGVEYYLLEQEGSRFSELETARRCLHSFRATHT
jgi:sugar phosphate isomerase/epimerase